MSYAITLEVIHTMRKVELTMDEEKKYKEIKKLAETNGNKKRVATNLGCTVRTVNRLLVKYRQQGKSAFSHGNKGRIPAIALSTELRNTIALLYENKYFNSNLRHFSQLLAIHEDIHVSEGSVRNILLERNILSPKARHSTRRELRDKLRAQKDSATSIKEKERLQETILTVSDPHPRRPRCAYAGEMIQLDASLHLWFGASKATLHAAIDDATGRIVGAYFDQQETLHGYYHVFHQILTQYGIPYLFYTDRRTVFEYKRKHPSDPEKCSLTQFGYACKQLGVDLKTTSVAPAKGRVERLFGTLQSRLPIELRLAGVTTIKQANEFLNSYIKEFNAKFALPFHNSNSVFETQPEPSQIDLYLSVLSSRKVDAGHCIHFQNKYYRLLDDQGSFTDFHKGTAALVAQTFSGALYCCACGRVYAMTEVPLHEQRSRYLDPVDKVPKEKKKPYIPPMAHPWRNDNFMKYVYAMVGREGTWAY